QGSKRKSSVRVFNYTSPVIRMVTYILRDAFQFLIQHEHRHINQATRVKRNDNFPKDSTCLPF
ncbi:MAG TPA: hypothetical protein VE933_13915, partial [Chitinophagaceae bacterium]|nr:hypothetical protein [Chitinophagaceae bacterium]